MSVGERLTLLRKTLDINQTDMAMTIGCTQGNISQYEKDGSTMSIKYLIPLRSAYSVNLDWLLLGIGKMFVSDTGTGIPQPADIPLIKGGGNPKKNEKLVKEINQLSADVQKTLQKVAKYISE